MSEGCPLAWGESQHQGPAPGLTGLCASLEICRLRGHGVEPRSWEGALKPATVAAIVPAFNETGKIGDVVRKVPREYIEHVIVVDDASSDATAEEARSAGAEHVIIHPENRGAGAAIRTGLYTARDLGCDVGVVLSGDDQHEPAEVPRLLEPLARGEADLVQGSRWLPGGATPGIPPHRRWLTRLYPLLLRLASGFPSTDGTNGFRAIRLSLLEDSRIRLDQPWLDRYELEPYLLYSVMRCGYRVREAPVTVRYHDRGTTKMRLFQDGWKILRPIVYLRLGIKD